MRTLIECVPNFSEGRNVTTINAIADAISSTPNVQLLNVDSNESANRTVYTFIGSPDAVSEAAFQAIKTASFLINMTLHKGEHPRIGACDVCPLIPVSGINMDEVAIHAKKLSERVANELLIPVYNYENNSNLSYRKRLEQIRFGEYEMLQEKMLFPEWQPDYGYNIFNHKSGATVIGARQFLIAYNVNLKTENLLLAKEIAKEIRESGFNNKPGLLKNVKAIAWKIEDFDTIQVSTNITDYSVTSIFQVYKTISKLAQNKGITVSGSELIGLVPFDALYQTSLEFQKQQGTSILSKIESLQFAAEQLGLNDVKPFNLTEQVLELKAGIYKETNLHQKL